MLSGVSMQSWSIFIVALTLIAAALILAHRSRLKARVLVLIGLGLTCIALAAGGTRWDWHADGIVAVMIDLSPSTRGAAYRDPLWLEQAVRRLIGQGKPHLFLFSNTNHLLQGWPAHPLGDLPADHTVFAPPPNADAILLFSDARFALPAAAPPTYVVPDPSLEQASQRDAAVMNLHVEGDQVVADVKGNASIEGEEWKLINAGINLNQVPASVFHHPLSPQQTSITARLSHSDLWPENNVLSIRPPTPWATERWWVGSSPPGGWKVMTPDQLPLEASAYLRPSVIALNNVTPSSLSALQEDRLEQYVRDLGGGLLIAGSSHIFAPGDDGGAALQGLSPLSSDPPEPMRRWIILLDASGSMNQSGGDRSRWQWASAALHSALQVLPGMDQVDVGGFSDRPHWWSQGRSARQVRTMTLPPLNAYPQGPTNLSESMNQIVAESNDASGANIPTELLILTDAEARPPNAAMLASQMQRRGMHFWLLATAEGEALNSLKEIADRTGGAVLEESRLTHWAKALRHLADKARGDNVRHDPIRIRFEGAIQGLESREVLLWRPSWLKDGATPLGTANDQRATSGVLAASWHVGSGQVAAAAFDPSAGETQALAQLVEAHPSDARIKVSWTTGRTVRVRVDARDHQKFLNGLDLKLTLQPQGDTLPIRQSGPGQYEAVFPAPRHNVLATVEQNTEPIDRIALPGRYAPEFDNVGNDHAAMIKLAKLTGGKVIDARQTGPINFHWPHRTVSLAPWLAILGAAFIAGGLAWWRISA
jgi:hypothetical protein